MKFMGMLAMFMLLNNDFAMAAITDTELAKAISEAKNLGNNFNIENSYNKLLPREEDREFVRKNKDKYNLTEDDILDASRSRFDREVAKGKIEDLNTIPAEKLNEKSTLLSIRNDEDSKDRSGTTPKEYMDIAVKSDENARKYQQDLEEKPFLDSIAIMDNPKKKLKEDYGINIDCQAEANDPQKDLEPETETYQVTTKKIETIEEQKNCEESEPVILQCDRNLSLSCDTTIPCLFSKKGYGGLFEGCGTGDVAHTTNGIPWEYDNGILSFGRSHPWTYGHPNHGSRSCLSAAFEAKFCIKNKTKVEEFKIIQIHENNVLSIYFNGVLVRDGETIARQAKGGRYCWYKAGRTVWDNFSYDLKPFLRDGENVISIKLKYTMGGHAGLKIKASAYCCDKWQEKWENKCEQHLNWVQ